MSAIAILELALTLLPKITVGLTEFVAWVATLRKAAQQADEWTADHESMWRDALISQGLDPAEMPD